MMPPKRPPDFVISRDDGTPYLRRWWLIPRNPIVNIYLHQFSGSDEDRALHCHPWISLSRILKGTYVEVKPVRQSQPGALDYAPFGTIKTRHFEGAWIFRRAKFRHRLVIDEGCECWTLFITGPVIRNWGFHCAKGWRRWQDFVSARDKGSVGRGCGD